MKNKCVNWTIAVNSNPIRIDYMAQEPDMSWVRPDANGHIHQWYKTPEGDYVVFGCRAIKRPGAYLGGEEYYYTVWECQHCGIEVYPQWTFCEKTDYIEGITGWSGTMDFLTGDVEWSDQPFPISDYIPELSGLVIMTELDLNFPVPFEGGLVRGTRITFRGTEELNHAAKT